MDTKESIIRMLDDTTLFRNIGDAEGFVTDLEDGPFFAYIDGFINKDSIIWDMEDAKNDKEANEVFDGPALYIKDVSISYRDLLNATYSDSGELVIQKNPANGIHSEIFLRLFKTLYLS